MLCPFDAYRIRQVWTNSSLWRLWVLDHLAELCLYDTRAAHDILQWKILDKQKVILVLFCKYSTLLVIFWILVCEGGLTSGAILCENDDQQLEI